MARGSSSMVAGIIKPPKPEESRQFYQAVSCGRLDRYIWGKKKRFDPVRFIGSPSVSRYFTHKVAPFISLRDRVLDVGCGSGVFLPVLAPLCDQLVGLDISQELLQESSGILQRFDLANVQVVNSLAEQMPFRDGEFDVLILVDALHHIFNLEETLTEIRRVLKPDGRILAFEPNKLNPLLWLLCLLDRNEWGALSLGSKRSYRRLFRKHFIIEQMEYNGLLLGPDTPLNRSIVDFLFAPIARQLIGWQSPKLFMVMTLKS
jgi:ubiquinone/menaquinone biosynthesis C-methylase UbiE